MNSLTNQQPQGSKTPRKTVALNAGSIFFGRLISAFSIWFALIILAKLSGPETVGTYAFAQALCIPIAEIAKLGLREVRSSDVTQQYSTADYFNLRIIMSGVAFIVMMGAGAWQAATTTVLIVIGIYALVRMCELVADICYAHFQQHERMVYIGRSLCISGPLSLLALSVGFYLTDSLIVAVSGQFVAHLLVLLFHDLPMSRALDRGDNAQLNGPKWNSDAIMRLARVSMSLGLATVFITIAAFAPRIWVGNTLGIVALGIFGPTLALVMAPDRLVSAVCIALSVRLARNYSQGNLSAVFWSIGKVIGLLVVLGVPGIVICAIYGEQILALVYTEEFASHGHILPILATAALLRILANVMNFGVIAAQRFWWVTAQKSVVAGAAIVACLLLIGPYGLVGASYAVLAINGVQFIVATIGLVQLGRNNTRVAI